MNRLFVNVKVDREERPDLDQIYQIAHQMLTQRGGGWPLTMFLAPDDLTPFFGGTYFPREARYGLPAFAELLERVAAFYRDPRATPCASRTRTLRRRSAGLVPPAARTARSTRAPLAAARRELEASFDARSAASAARRSSRIRPASSACCALAVDRGDARTGPAGALHGDAHAEAHGRRRPLRPARRRLLPLLGRPVLDDPALREDALRQRPAARPVRAQAAVADWRSALPRRSPSQTADWALARNARAGGRLLLGAGCRLRRPRGSLLRLGPRRSRVAARRRRSIAWLARRCGLDREPNFEGRWHLHCLASLEDIAAEGGHTVDSVAALLDSGRAKLLAARAQRVRPDP